MQNFQQLNLPIFSELKDEIYNLLKNNSIQWTRHNQICINTTIDQPDNYKLGAGSLMYDWDNSLVINNNGEEKVVLPKRDTLLKPEDFTILCSVFKNTLLEKLYYELTQVYKVGRIRLMNSFSKTCYTWHVDSTPRIHYVIDTHPGCFMIIDNEIRHLPNNTWWLTDTTKFHTAFNGSVQNRIHLVAELLE